LFHDITPVWLITSVKVTEYAVAAPLALQAATE
jgi:hypothetical protein